MIRKGKGRGYGVLPPPKPPPPPKDLSLPLIKDFASTSLSTPRHHLLITQSCHGLASKLYIILYVITNCHVTHNLPHMIIIITNHPYIPIFCCHITTTSSIVTMSSNRCSNCQSLPSHCPIILLRSIRKNVGDAPTSLLHSFCYVSSYLIQSHNDC
jgi:hypothetical protein